MEIRDLMRNCSEKQYEYIDLYCYLEDIRFYHLYSGNDKSYRAAVKYDKEGSAIELIFLSEEEERNYLFYKKGIHGIWCTAELCKYYLHKYYFLYERAEESHYCAGAIHKIYNQEGAVVFYWYDE